MSKKETRCEICEVRYKFSKKKPLTETRKKICFNCERQINIFLKLVAERRSMQSELTTEEFIGNLIQFIGQSVIDKTRENISNVVGSDDINMSYEWLRDVDTKNWL